MAELEASLAGAGAEAEALRSQLEAQAAGAMLLSRALEEAEQSHQVGRGVGMFLCPRG